MRQQVGEPKEYFPVRGSLRQPVVKPRVNNQVLANRTGNGPKISHGIATEERLREMPDFTRQRELSERMGDRQGLPKLQSMHFTHYLLGKNPICIEMEAQEIVAQQNRA